MSAAGLGDAVVALVPTTHGPVYEVRVPGTARPPWHVVSVRVPDVSERSLASPGQAHDVTLLVKCVAGTAKGVRLMLDTVHAAIEGVRPVAERWRCGPLLHLNTRWDPTEGTNAVLPGGTLPVFEGVIEYRCTATATA